MSIWLKLLLVGVSGGIGAICRFLIEQLMKTANAWMGMSTLVINVLGCFIIGVCAGWLLISPWDWQHKTAFTLILMTGFCGGFSTFSAFTLDCVKYFESGHIAIWIVFGSATVFIGLLACAFGYWLGTKI